MGQQVERVEQIAAVVGLGNPGKQYEATRHNVGFRVLDRLALSFSVKLEERKFPASWGTCMIERRKVLLLKPLTYMNRSGEAVSQMLRYFKILPKQMLVIHDDLDLSLGRIRLAQRGGAGGHRGVTSIMENLGDQDFARLKLGIGRPLHDETVEAYVLHSPYPQQEGAFEEMVKRGEEAAHRVLLSGMVSAMNVFNRNDVSIEAAPRVTQETRPTHRSVPSS
jgi:peptidyl-tRNA hydrolase, PTH1 family